MIINSAMIDPVTIITKNATPYEMNGNRGITYRLVVMAGNDVEKIKCVDEKAYNLFEPGKNYVLTGQVSISNARCGEWKVNGFVPMPGK